MNDERQMKFLKSLLETELDPEMFADQISLFSRFLVYSNPGYYYNETYLPSFCSEFIKFQEYVKFKNNIFLEIIKKIVSLSSDLDFEFLMDQFWKYSSKDGTLGISTPIDVKQICADKLSIKCILIYEDKQHLFLRTYGEDIEYKKPQDKVVEKASEELKKWIEDVCNGKSE